MRSSTLAALVGVPLVWTPAWAENLVEKDLTVEQSSAAAAGVAHPGSLKVSVSADRPDATYALGETARLFVNSNEDAYVTVLNIGPSGQVTQLFPNPYQTDNHVVANQPVEIAGGLSEARITVSGAVGKELVKVVASNKPLTVISESQLQGGGAFRSVTGGVATLSRNLEVASHDDRKIAISNFYLKTIASRAAHEPRQVVVLAGPTPAAQPAQPTQGTPTVLPVVVPSAAPQAVSVPVQQAFPLLLAVDKQAYKVGEAVTLAVTSLQACYLTVLDVTPSGAVRVLFPNKVTRNNSLATQQTVLVAGGSSPVSLVVAGPAGTEEIVAICSTDPAPVIGVKGESSEMFPLAGERASIVRDLAVVASRPATSTAKASFSVQP